MDVQFRECDWGNLWLWFEFAEFPDDGDRQYLEQLLESWYTLGTLGGFNATATPVQEAGDDISYLDYVPVPDALPSLMHNMGSVEYEGEWGRCWFDLGTVDAIAIDVLLNAMATLSVEYVKLKRVVVGGINEDWPVPEMGEGQSLNGFSDNHWE